MPLMWNEDNSENKDFTSHTHGFHATWTHHTLEKYPLDQAVKLEESCNCKKPFLLLS